MEHTIKINNKLKIIEAPPNKRLLDVIRDELHIKSPKEGCGSGDCGACSIILNDQLVTSCLVLFSHLKPEIVNEITTVDKKNDIFDELKTQFLIHGGAQCGICIPGIIVTSYDILNTNLHATIDEIKDGLGGNLCRCTGYTKIIRSIQEAQQTLINK